MYFWTDQVSCQVEPIPLSNPPKGVARRSWDVLAERRKLLCAVGHGVWQWTMHQARFLALDEATNQDLAAHQQVQLPELAARHGNLGVLEDSDDVWKDQGEQRADKSNDRPFSSSSSTRQ